MPKYGVTVKKTEVTYRILIVLADSFKEAKEKAERMAPKLNFSLGGCSKRPVFEIEGVAKADAINVSLVDPIKAARARSLLLELSNAVTEHNLNRRLFCKSDWAHICCEPDGASGTVAVELVDPLGEAFLAARLESLLADLSLLAATTAPRASNE